MVVLFSRAMGFIVFATAMAHLGFVVSTAPPTNTTEAPTNLTEVYGNFTFDWDIEPIAVQQGTDISEPISFSYRIPMLDYHHKQCSFRILDYNCQPKDSLTFPDALYVNGVTTGKQRLEANVWIASDEIESSGYYGAYNDYRDHVAFCARIDCTFDGESIHFYETKYGFTIDLLTGFAMTAEVIDPYSLNKTLDSYEVSFYPTDGDLDDESLRIFEAATNEFLAQEISAWFNNTAHINATVLAQGQVQKNVTTGRRVLRNPAVPRSLQGSETLTGSKLAMGIHVEFENDPAPHTDEVNEALQHIWIDEFNFFLKNLQAVYTMCKSESNDIFQTTRHETSKQGT